MEMANESDPRQELELSPLLTVFFLLSGCAALVYEVVWFQLLRLVIGASSISLGILLASFMGGMCLGSLACPRLMPRRAHPLRFYALLEAGIGISGVMLPLVLPPLSRIYSASVDPGSGLALRGIVAGIVLLPPAALMGATLPAIARCVQSTPRGIASLGRLYAANTLGAVIGCVLAGFWLLPFYDVSIATGFAVAINAGIALLALALSRKNPALPSVPATDAPSRSSPSTVLLAIGLSGFTALGAQVIWTRHLSLLFGVTVYTFSIILAVFLAGLGAGSGIGARIVSRVRRADLALAVTQLLLVASIPYAAFVIAFGLPAWPRARALESSMLFGLFFSDTLRTALVLLPSTLCWGASFPLALAAAGIGNNDPSRATARVYAANTAGAIAGSLCFTFVGIPMFGTVTSQRALVLVAAAAGIGLLVFGRSRPPAWLTAVSILGLAAGVALVPALPDRISIHGRLVMQSDYEKFHWSQGEAIDLVEGITAPVGVWLSRGVRSLHVGGKAVASDHVLDMWLQRTLGHLPALVHGGPKSVLVVGMGAGVTAGAFVLHKGVEQITVCEIEPRVPEAASAHFSGPNHSVLQDPRTRLVVDDGRHFLATTSENFDLITSDPIHPYVRGAAALYSEEYYRLAKSRLNPGGVIAQWVPLYETDAAAVKSEIAAFASIFPDATFWRAPGSYDLIMLARRDGAPIDASQLERGLAANPRVRDALSPIGMDSAIRILHAYGTNAHDLAPWLKDAEVNRDSNLRLEYLAALAVDHKDARSLYGEIDAYRRWPTAAVRLTPELVSELREHPAPRPGPGSTP